MEGLLLYVFYRTVWQKKYTLRADKCVHSLMEVSEHICSISRECTHTYSRYINLVASDWLFHNLLAIVYEDASAWVSSGSARERIVHVIVRCRFSDSRRARDVGSGLYAYLRSR